MTDFDPESPPPERPVVRDRRRLDPDTGRVRQPADGGSPAGGAQRASGGQRAGAQRAGGQRAGGSRRAEANPEPDGAPAEPGWFDAGEPAAEGGSVFATPPGGADAPPDTGPQQAPSGADQSAGQPDPDRLAQAERLAEERLADLQRLQAEYVNYRRRVERDRTVARDSAVADVLESLLSVLDDIHLARQHGDLESGPFAAIAEKLEATLARFGLERYGEPGEPFDPNIHEALIHSKDAELAAGATEPTVVQVLQPGYRAADRVLRAARVAVADP